ncbi:MAG TPA: hypothetical protein VNN21_10545 [Dehalococcoidia bacterium]|nr:hypothetical protein [Dehalococcoidia bacterium]
MENAIPTLVIGAIILAAIGILGRDSLHAYDEMGLSLREMETRIVARAGTQLVVTQTSVDPSGGVVTVSLRNDGRTRIGDFAALDVILTYYSAPASQVNVWLPYSASGPATNAWTLLSILNDAYEPGILNPGETANLRLDVSPSIAAGQTNSLVIATELGSTVEAAFSS